MTDDDFLAKLSEVIEFARKIEDLKKRFLAGVRQNAKMTDIMSVDVTVEDCAIIAALVDKALE